jgi:hypothetical protein
MRKEPLDDGGFHRYWREAHRPIVRPIKELRMYAQGHRICYA